MPDFEIRYFDAHDELAIVRITSLGSFEEAEAHARQHQGSHLRYEIREIGDSAK